MTENQEIRLTTTDPSITNVIYSIPSGIGFAREVKEQTINTIVIDENTTQTTIINVITRKNGLNEKFL